MFIIISVFTSCDESDGSNHTFNVSLPANPQNLDPQLSSDNESKMILYNTMEGLLKMSENGSAEPAAAESYDVSEDGLFYTFKIKEGLSWSGGEDFSAPLTAYDFEFAFRRIFDPASHSPHGELFSCIWNASDILSGVREPYELGVRAEDEYTLTIRLEYPYIDFLKLMTHTAALPCNEEFFKGAKGRYGLGAEACASNGSFRIADWNYDPYWNDNYIILERNSENSELGRVYPRYVKFFIGGSSEDVYLNYAAGEIDCLITGDYDKKLVSSNGHKAYRSKTYGLVFNPEDQYFKHEGLRRAASLVIDRGLFVAENVPEDLSVAYGIIPPAVTVLNKSYRELVADGVLNNADFSAGKRLWKETLDANGIISADGLKITVPESFSGAEILDSIIQTWQSELEFFCGIEVVSQAEYEKKLSEGSFGIALIDISSDGNSAADFLKNFSPNSRREAVIKYSSLRFEEMLKNLKTAGAPNAAAKLYSEAEAFLISEAAFVPLFYGNEYLMTRKNCEGLVYIPYTGQVLFRDGKMFD